jgi:hypothetical protein
MKTFIGIEEANEYVRNNPVVMVVYRGDLVEVYEPGDELPEVGGNE